MEESGSQMPQEILIGLPTSGPVQPEPLEPEPLEPDPLEPGPARRLKPGLRAVLMECAVGLAVLGAVGVLGVPMGLLWRAVSPKVTLERIGDGWTTVEELPEGYMADDGWFLVITAVVGVCVAILAWSLLRRFRGPAVLVGLAVGSVAAAALAAWLGHRIGLSGYHKTLETAPVGARVGRLPKLLIRHSPLVQGGMAAMTYTLLAAFHYSPTLQREQMTFDPAAGMPPAEMPPAGMPPAEMPPAGMPPAGMAPGGMPPAGSDSVPDGTEWPA